MNADSRADKVNTEYVYTRHATSMRSFSKLNPMRTLGQSQRGSTHTREFEDTAWERLRNAAQTSTCCCGRRPRPQQSTIGAKSVPLLRKQLSQLTWQYTAADGVQKSPCRERASGSQGRIWPSQHNNAQPTGPTKTHPTSSARRTAHVMRLRPLPFLGDPLRGRIGTKLCTLARRPLPPSCALMLTPL